MATAQNDPPEEEIALGTAGTSARRAHERRCANREQRTRERHPLVGGALLALRDAPAHERVWGTGAAGEEATALRLAERCPRALVLHDRRMPRSRANIDHIAVAPGGVVVIDSKHYNGRKVRVVDPVFGPARLTIDGRERSKLVDGLLWQVETVTGVMAEIDAGVPVAGAFCFVDADLPLLGTPTIHGLPVLGLRRLAKLINREGPLSDEQIRLVATGLAQRLKPA